MSDSIRKLRKGSLLIANHQSILDPFIILAYLPFRNFLKLIPIREPTCHRYAAKIPFLSFVGGYDIGSSSREKMESLFKTRQFLTDKRSVMIFPEGRICDRDKDLEFKKGVSFLTDAAENVVFVRLNGFHYQDWTQFKNFERVLVFSEVQKFQEEQSAESIKEKIKNLS